MKKLLTLLLVLMLAFTLVACSSNDTPPVSDPQPEVVDPVTEPEDGDVEEPAAPEGDVLYDAAMDYFASFPDSRHMINADALIERVRAGEDLFIIDIRRAADYEEGHIEGAYNLPYGTDIADALDQLPDDEEIFVLCYTGQTSSQTTALLNIAGKFATNIQGGFNNGISAQDGYEDIITTEATPLPDGNYPVAGEIKTAIHDYYADATSNTFSSFNISVDAVKELVDAGSTDYQILSVRQAADYADGHIEGAVNIPFGNGMQADFESVLSKDKPVIVYCYTGQTSSQTVGVLRMLGYEAYNMSQGMTNGWLANGYDVVTD